MNRKSTDLLLRFAPDFGSPTVDSADPTRFAGVCYSGGVVPNYGMFGDIAIDLATLQQPGKALFSLVNHDPNQRAGKCVISNDGRQVSIDGTFMSTPAGSQVAREFAEGAPWEFSVRINGRPDVFEQPTTIDLNGRAMTVDTVFRNASVREVSFVPAGADPNTQAVAFALENAMSEPNLLELTRALEAERYEKDALKATVAELQAASTVFVAQLADRDAEIVRLTDSVKQANDHLDQVAVELSELKTANRLKDVKALFADIGREFSDESAQPYLALADDTFAFMASDLRSIRSAKVDPLLFQEQATAGRDGSDDTGLVALADSIRKQHPNLTQEQSVALALKQNPALYADPRNLGAR